MAWRRSVGEKLRGKGGGRVRAPLGFECRAQWREGKSWGCRGRGAAASHGRRSGGWRWLEKLTSGTAVSVTGREGERKVGRWEWVGPETADGPRKREKRKKGGEVGRGKLGSNRKGRERFWRFGFLLFFSFLSFLNTHQPNKSNQNNATHIHIYLIYKYKQLPFYYTNFPVKRIIVGKILNYEKIVD
jgi:hypothetical protein